MYDIIGDIHGHATELEQLLELLGYRRDRAGFHHPDRQALFVGDFIDRGPRIADTLRIVRSMVDAGSARAVMGNHEFNAIAYHTPDGRGGYLRPHSAKNTKQHEQTLRQLSASELTEALEWFRVLPMWLELESLRVVHACWDAVGIDFIANCWPSNEPLSGDFMAEACDHESQVFHEVDHILKGTEMALPNGMSYLDKDGHERTEIRTRWFDSPADQDMAEYAMPRMAERIGVSIDEHIPVVAPYQVDEPPVFFGHYWLSGVPGPQTVNAACVDYSVAKGGSLVAYSWDGETSLLPEKYVCIAAEE